MRSPGALVVFALAVAAAVVLAAPASAHKGGKAEPRIAAGISAKPGLDRALTVRLTDVDSRDPIPNARVSAVAEMATGHSMRTGRVRLAEARPGIYTARIRFPTAGDWSVRIAVTGEKVIPATANLPVRVTAPSTGGAPPEPIEEPAGGHGAAAQVHALPTTVEDTLTTHDFVRMASLWTHALAALGWIIGVLAMTLALSTRPGVLAETARTRLADAYARWGAWVHWSLVLLIVGTGVYQMFYVTPFPLAYTPSDFANLREIPYGPLYEAILITKLSLFAILLVTGTMMLLRVIHAPLPMVPVSNPHPGFVRVLVSALGPAGVVYLATVPLILAAAMALRYVHVLSHVAEALQSG